MGKVEPFSCYRAQDHIKQWQRIRTGLICDYLLASFPQKPRYLNAHGGILRRVRVGLTEIRTGTRQVIRSLADKDVKYVRQQHRGTNKINGILDAID